MKNFLKGIVIGLGAVAPGLSGSILLVIFGLYQKTVTAISQIFKQFIKSVKFLMPLALGILLGILMFSKLVDWLLTSFEMQTRFAFLGFILGSLPMFYREVKKEGFHPKYYLVMACGLLLGVILFGFNRNLFPEITSPNLLQSVLLGLVVAASYIVPGVDSAAILSAFGLYNLWVSSLANINLTVLLPAAVGLVVGVLGVSMLIKMLISKCYTLTFSAIFGLFLSVVPSVLNERCVPGLNVQTLVSGILLVVGVVLSLLFGKLEKLTER